MKKMNIDEVKHVAKLANIKISDKEAVKLKNELEKTIEYVDILNQIDTSKEEPTSHVTGLSNVYRKDVPINSLSQEDAISQAKYTHNGYYIVDGVLNKD